MTHLKHIYPLYERNLTCLRPVLVHEEERLSRALLATAGVRILIALPSNIVHISHIWSQDLPVKASILQKYLQQLLLS